MAEHGRPVLEDAGVGPVVEPGAGDPLDDPVVVGVGERLHGLLREDGPGLLPVDVQQVAVVRPTQVEPLHRLEVRKNKGNGIFYLRKM